MDYTRSITPSLRAGLLVAVGSALLAVPFAVGLSVAAVVTAGAAGVVAVGLGLAGTATSGRGTLPLSAHAAYDRGLALGLALAGLAFGVAGEPGALAFFIVAGTVLLALVSATR